MDDKQLIQNLAIFAIPLLFALTVHEFAHGYIAKLRGDNTAYIAGRLTLNPAKHIDIWGTIAMPLLLYFSTAGTFWFGYAKPIPINTKNFKNYKKDIFVTIAAGPLSNLIMAFLWGILLTILLKFQVSEVFFLKMCNYGIIINLSLFALNLFPLLPLDGGRLLLLFLPYKYAVNFSRLEPYGFMIILLLSFSTILTKFWLFPIIKFFSAIISLMF